MTPGQCLLWPGEMSWRRDVASILRDITLMADDHRRGCCARHQENRRAFYGLLILPSDARGMSMRQGIAMGLLTRRLAKDDTCQLVEGRAMRGDGASACDEIGRTIWHSGESTRTHGDFSAIFSCRALATMAHVISRIA